MKKIKKIFYIFNILLIIFLIFSKNLSNIDEVINYNFGRYIANGYEIYKDFNCIVFPMFPMILGVIFKIFGEELIIYRVFQILILLLIEFYFIKILKKLNLDDSFLANVLLTIFIVLISIFSLVEYNMLNCLILLIIINEELKENKTIKNYILIGVFLGIAITVKQSVGLIILICSLIISLFEKERIKKFLLKVFGAGIIVGLMAIYLFATNSVYDWCNYTLLGLSSFIPYFGVFLYGNYFIALLTIILIIVEILAIIKIFRTKDKTGIILFIYGLASFSVMYPIFDENHILIGFLPNLILYIYLFIKNSELNDKQINSFKITLYIVIIAIGILNIANFVSMSSQNEFEHYKFIMMDDNTKQDLRTIIDFMSKHENSYIVDTKGIFYMVPQNRFNGILDLPNVGNTGKDGEQALIEKINKIDEGYFLVQDFSKINPAQNPLKAIKYIKDNFKYIETINNFEIYYK